MKRVLKVCVVWVLALAMMVGATVTAYAASKEHATGIVKVVDAEGNEIYVGTYEVSDPSVQLTAEKAAEIIGCAVADIVAIPWQHDLTATPPITVTFEVAAEADQEVYVFHYGSDWEIVASGKGSTVVATFDSLSPVAIVVKNTSSSTSGGDSSTTANPTGDNNNIVLWGALMVVAAAGAVGTIVYSKKRKTN